MTPARATLAALIALVVAGPAAAHGVGVQATLAGGTVRVEGFFDDDTPAAAAKVTVVEDGRTVAEGTTDDRGVWTFPAPPPGTYRVLIDAGAGHRAAANLVIPAAGAAPAVVTDGPDRATATGPRKWLMAAAGLAAIAVLTLIARRAARST
jgi:hypothetical protein